jgi:hypothetical protein
MARSPMGVDCVSLDLVLAQGVCTSLEFVPATKMMWLADLVKCGASGALGAALTKNLPRMHE